MRKRADRAEQHMQTGRHAPDWWARAGVLAVMLGLLMQWYFTSAEQARQREEHARSLEVTLLFDTMLAPGGAGLPKALTIRAKNPSPQTHDIWVNQAGIVLPNGSMAFAPNPALGDWQFPCLIPPGQNRSYLFTGQALQAVCHFAQDNGYERAVEFVGFYVDGDDVIHKSKPLQFNVEDGLKLARTQIQGGTPAGASGTSKSQ